MDFKTLLNKTYNTVKLIMTQPTMMFRNKANAEIIAEHVVTEDDKVRPDLIALKYYGDHTKTDMILKFNRISDPFSIMPGEVILVPSPDTAYYRLERPMSIEDNIVKRQFVDTKRLSEKDQRRIEALKKKYNKETLLPPNVIPVGRKNYEFNGNQVRMGAQVQTDPVTESITAEVIASQNAENAQSQRDAILAQQGNGDGNDGTENGDGNTGNGFTDTQAENALDGGSGKGGSGSGANGQSNEDSGEKSDGADGTGDNNNGGDNESGSDQNTPPSDDSPCAK
tara:strand:- start:1791 stop:2636 length:846 start_codon:yes stop_codon:yes gene_type:complete